MHTSAIQLENGKIPGSERFWRALLTGELAFLCFLIPAGRFAAEPFGIYVSIGFDIYRLFPYLFFTWWLWRRTIPKRSLPSSPFLLPLFSFFLVSLLAAVGSPDPYESLSEVLEICFYLIFFLFLLDFPWSRKNLTCITGAFIAGCLYLGIVAIQQYLAASQAGVLPRISATFDFPNALGIFSLLAFTLLTWVFWHTHTFWQKGFVVLGLLSVLLALVLSLSRAAYLGLLIWSAVILFYRKRVYWKRALLTLLALISVILLVTPQITERITYFWSEMQRMESASRIYILPTVLSQEIPDLSFFGVGLGPVIAQRMENISAAAPSEFAIADGWHPHNLYLDLLLSTGWFGLFTFLWTIALAVYFLHQDSSFSSKIILAGISAFLVHQFFEVHLLLGNIPVLWIALLALAHYYQTLQPGRSQP
ncbi:MAG: O-antigen ligase family protein [bacterium]